LVPIIEEFEKIEDEDYLTINSPVKKITELLSQPLLILMAILASVIGSSFTALPILKGGSLTNEFNTLLITGAVSLLVITFISVLRTFKESQQEVTLSSGSQKILNAINFEKEIGELLSKKKYSILPSKINDGYDFLLSNMDKKILIEVKSWTDRVPTPYLERTMRRLKESVEKEQATEGIIVVQSPFEIKESLLEIKTIKILTKDELNKYL
jgi:Restriction endonuclease